MASSSIIKLNVGGQIFETNVHTLTKYPGSMLCAMFSYTQNGISPMPKTNEGLFFLDADPEYFRVILNWLRLGEIVAEKSSDLKGNWQYGLWSFKFGATKSVKVYLRMNSKETVQWCQALKHLFFYFCRSDFEILYFW